MTKENSHGGLLTNALLPIWFAEDLSISALGINLVSQLLARFYKLRRDFSFVRIRKEQKCVRKILQGCQKRFWYVLQRWIRVE